MRQLLLLIILLATSTGFAQGVSRAELTGTWHLEKMIQDSVCVFDFNDSTVLIGRVFAYSERMKQKLTHEDSLKILEQCRKKNKDMRQVFIRFLKNGTCQNRHIKPGPEGGLTDSIETGTYVFDKKAQTIEYSGSPKLSVRMAKGHLLLGFTVAITMKHQEVTMEYVKW